MNEMKPVQGSAAPLSLSDTPSLIETQFPVNRISAESYKERKAIHGQILTSLGSYWKGRKPLILARAAVLGALLPATAKPIEDLHVFLSLLGMDDRAFAKRLSKVKPTDVDMNWDRYDEVIVRGNRPTWRRDVNRKDRFAILNQWVLTLPYAKRLPFCLRPEECGVDLLDDVWPKVNAHLGTNANSVAGLIRELGIMRFGHTPNVADTFAGGGSIPFEAARLGCDAYASDLNPIACMLTWGAFNVIGAPAAKRGKISSAQKSVSDAIKTEIDNLDIENDAQGRKAKAYLYCVEVRCPKTGYLVPLAPSWVISKNHRTVAKLIPRPDRKDYEIKIVPDADDDEMKAAEQGTLVDERVVHPANPNRDGVALSVIRGDRKDVDGHSANSLRRWESSDIVPRPDDLFQERLYCIQWYNKLVIPLESDDIDEESEGLDGDGDDAVDSETASAPRGSVFFAAPTERDFQQEQKARNLVEEHLVKWQRDGLLPESEIEPGEKTDEPIRTRGWTHWHHLFLPRHLLFGAIALKHIKSVNDPICRGALLVGFCRTLNYMSRMTQWMVRNPTPKKPADVVNHVFYNQALNTFYNFGCRSSGSLLSSLRKRLPEVRLEAQGFIETRAASSLESVHDIYLTDPPYADAVNYHEITEYFIAWAAKLGTSIFPQFSWSSNRALAIKGADEKFRADMVAAYKSMAQHMPDNGLQIVMFTHQDSGVWADLAAIMWAAGLKVSAAWTVVTETESATKKGNFVQGTVLLVLRKRLDKLNGRRMNIEGEIEDEVKSQLALMNGVAEDWTSERLYTDGDLQLAAYAAALRIITAYETIDRRDVGADVFRKLPKGQKTVIRDLIDYAASVANNMLVPEGFPASLWREADATSRFYIRMLDMESKGATRYADYQDFAKTFALENYSDLMGSTKANKAALAGAAGLKASHLGETGFGTTALRRVLFAIYKTMQTDDPGKGVSYLRITFEDQYWSSRGKLVEYAKYISEKTARTRKDESAAADLLAQKLQVDRL